MAQETTASIWLRIAELFAQPFARPTTPARRTGACHLCGEQRDDLDDTDLCTPCAMMVW